MTSINKISKTGLIRYWVIVTAWFAVYATMTTLLPVLTTNGLSAGPKKIALVQASFFLTSLLLLFAGILADIFGKRLFIVVFPALGAIATACLIVHLQTGISLWGLTIFSLVMGISSAFFTPSREASLNDLSSSTFLPRAVVITTAMQFSGQVIGLIAVSRIDDIGEIWVFSGLTALLIIIAALGFTLKVSQPVQVSKPLTVILARLAKALTVPFNISQSLSVAITSGMVVGICFIGVWLVLIPDLVLEKHDANASKLGTGNLLFTVGTLITVGAIIFAPKLARAPSMLLNLGMLSGGIILSAISFTSTLTGIYITLFLWGGAAGAVTTGGRILIQTLTSTETRAHCIAMYQFGLLGGAPIGAFITGWILSHFTPIHASVGFE